MKTIYSLRTSLGREVWWTTSRRKAIDLATDVNAIGVGARVMPRGIAGEAITPGEGMRGHEMPVEVWRCSRVKVKP